MSNNKRQDIELFEPTHARKSNQANSADRIVKNKWIIWEVYKKITILK